MIARPAVVYSAVFITAALCRAALEFLPFDYALPNQRTVSSWGYFLIFAGCYAAGIALAVRAGLPSPGDTLARARTALALPAAVGVAVGLLTIASDVIAPVAAARGVATVHVIGPAAIPFYAYGAIVLTTVFHFLPVALVAWLARRLQGTWRMMVVFVGVAFVAFCEDTGWFLRAGATFDVEWARHALSVLANAAEAIFIYRFGLLAGLAQRTSTYFIWHLLWPALDAA
jgi:hypothetical protein